MDYMIDVLLHRVLWITAGYIFTFFGLAKCMIPTKTESPMFWSQTWGRVIFALTILVPVGVLIWQWGFWSTAYWTITIGLALFLALCTLGAALAVPEKWLIYSHKWIPHPVWYSLMLAAIVVFCATISGTIFLAHLITSQAA